MVDKPAGLTSHDVVARLRRLTGTRRVGHAGTLDPMATGVLLVGVGRATRLLGHLALREKAYDATVRLGQATSTDDAEGEVIATTSARDLPEESVRVEVARLTGTLSQVPSSMSAVKVGGRRAYALARAGERVELAPRTVTVSCFTIRELRRNGAFLDLEVGVECSTGTYVRALARDLGAALGVGGHLTALRRTRVGPYRVEHARTLEQLGSALEVLPLAEAAALAFPARRVDAAQAQGLAAGRALPAAGLGPGPTAVFGPDGSFLALVEERGDLARPVAVFA